MNPSRLIPWLYGVTVGVGYTFVLHQYMQISAINDISQPKPRNQYVFVPFKRVLFSRFIVVD